MQGLHGRHPEFQVYVPQDLRACVPARFGVEIIKSSPGEAAEYFGDRVSLLITDQLSNKFIQTLPRPISYFDTTFVNELVKSFEEILSKQKAA